MEISGGETHLFPYQQLITASLVQENALAVLRLAFSSHDIEITGHNLREVLAALQEFAVKWLRTVPQRYQQIAGEEFTIISHIRITPIV